jgi:hypothetical protein
VLWYRRSVTPLWKLDDYIPEPLQYSVFFKYVAREATQWDDLTVFFMALILRNHQNCVVIRKGRNSEKLWQKITGCEFLFDIYHVMTAEFYLFMNFYCLFFFFIFLLFFLPCQIKSTAFRLKEVRSLYNNICERQILKLGFM